MEASGRGKEGERDRKRGRAGEETGKEGALKEIQKIRERMKNTIYLENNGLKVRMSASFGIATYPEDTDDREGLLALADEAMFRIKARGKDAVGVTPSK